jgi:hypothetical protein
MANCALTVLEASACTNGFWGAAQSDVLADAVELQLLYAISGSTQTLAQLVASACDNGYFQVSQIPSTAEGAKLQLLCQISGG